MAYGESNGHVIDDVTWPRKVKLVTPIRLERNLETSQRKMIVPRYRIINGQLFIYLFIYLF